MSCGTATDSGSPRRSANKPDRLTVAMTWQPCGANCEESETDLGMPYPGWPVDASRKAAASTADESNVEIKRANIGRQQPAHRRNGSRGQRVVSCVAQESNSGGKKQIGSEQLEQDLIHAASTLSGSALLHERRLPVFTSESDRSAATRTKLWRASTLAQLEASTQRSFGASSA
jgi:hypothetical protein